MAWAYNRQPGPPRVLIGNWVEEMSYWEAKKAYMERVENGEEILEPACPTLELATGNLYLDQEFCTTNGDYGDFGSEKKNVPQYSKPIWSRTTMTAAQIRAAEKEADGHILDQTCSHDFLGASGAAADCASTTRTDYHREPLASAAEPAFEEHLKLYNTSRRLADVQRAREGADIDRVDSALPTN